MFTLVACLFFIIVLLLVNIGLVNKKTSQEKELKEISKAYEINEQNMEDEYAKVAEENEYLTASQIQELIYKNSTYKPGDICNFKKLSLGGYLTDSGRSFGTTIFIDKPVDETVKEIMISGKVTCIQNDNYLLGEPYNGATTGFLMKIGKFDLFALQTVINVSSKHSKAINNDAVGIVLEDVKITFQ